MHGAHARAMSQRRHTDDRAPCSSSRQFRPMVFSIQLKQTSTHLTQNYTEYRHGGALAVGRPRLWCAPRASSYTGSGTGCSPPSVFRSYTPSRRLRPANRHVSEHSYSWEIMHVGLPVGAPAMVIMHPHHQASEQISLRHISDTCQIQFQRRRRLLIAHVVPRLSNCMPA